MVHVSLRDVRQHYSLGYLLNCDFLLLKRKKESTPDTVMVLLKNRYWRFRFNRSISLFHFFRDFVWFDGKYLFPKIDEPSAIKLQISKRKL